jgi:hypothetical protein
MKNWVEDNHNAPEYLPRMIGREVQLDYIALINFQRTGERLDKYLRISLNMCTRLHTTTTTLETKCKLPQIGELDKPSSYDQVQMEMEEAMSFRELTFIIPQRVAYSMMSEHMIIPWKVLIIWVGCH